MILILHIKQKVNNLVTDDYYLIASLFKPKNQNLWDFLKNSNSLPCGEM